MIVDQVLPNTGVAPFSALMNLTMMTSGGMERTEKQCRKLLEGVGLSIISIEGREVVTLSLDSTMKANPRV